MRRVGLRVIIMTNITKNNYEEERNLSYHQILEKYSLAESKGKDLRRP